MQETSSINQLNSKLQNAGLRPINDESIQMRTIGQTIDFNSILQVIDTLGIKNYTFRIINHPNDDYKTFHNLVVTEIGSEIETTLMKYEMKEEFAQQYNAGLKLFQQFEGKVTAAGFSPSPLTPKPCEEVVKDVIPIPDFSVVNPTPGGGSPSGGGGSGGVNGGTTSGNGSGYGTGSGSGSSTICLQLMALPKCTNCNTSFDNWDSYFNAECSNGKYGLTFVLSYSIANCRLATDPCNPNGDIGVLEPIDDECSKTIATTFIESLSMEQKAWWEDSENASERAEIENYIKDNGCEEESKEFAKEAIEALRNGENCVIMPTVFNPTEIQANFNPNLFGDYIEPTVQQDHNAIQQQFNHLRNNDGDLAAVTYLINTYNMNTFGSNTINFNYSISLVNGLPNGDLGRTIIGYNSNGIMNSCELKIDTNLLAFTDFGFITRVIKHELYHVLQAEHYGQYGISIAAKEFDAYYYQIFGFRDLKKIQNLDLVCQLSKYMVDYMSQLSNSEKEEKPNMIDLVNQTFPRICNE